MSIGFWDDYKWVSLRINEIRDNQIREMLTLYIYLDCILRTSPAWTFVLHNDFDISTNRGTRMWKILLHPGESITRYAKVLDCIWWKYVIVVEQQIQRNMVYRRSFPFSVWGQFLDYIFCNDCPHSFPVFFSCAM